MRWFKILAIILMLITGAYVGLMYSLEDRKTLVVERELSYPIDKVFPQFENLQQLTRWSGFFRDKEVYAFQYFLPYEGVGSAMRFVNVKDNDEAGDIFIRDLKPMKSIRYEIYEKGEKTSYKVEAIFQSKGEKTKITWKIETPTIPLMMRFLTLNADDKMEQNISSGMNKLTKILSGKVDAEVRLSQIKYDSIMEEEQEAKLLLGMNITAVNKKGMLHKSIVVHHHKLMSFVSKDLAKQEDEYGLPVLMTDIDGLRDKEISYFYGVSLPKSEKITDNNFVFKNLEKSRVYSIYYKGSYENRRRAVDKLLAEIKKSELRHGLLEEFFVEPPIEDEEVLLKISIPVY